MDNIYIQAGQRIRMLREKNRFTREQFAELVDISPKFLYEIETGQKGFSAKTLLGIARGLGSSCEFILTGNCSDEALFDYINLYDDSQKLLVNQILKLIMELSLQSK